MREIGSYIPEWLVNIGRGLATLLMYSVVLVMFFATFILVAFTATQVALTANVKAEGILLHLISFTNAAFSMIGVDIVKLTLEKSNAVLSSALGTFAVLVTLWYSFFAIISHFRHQGELKRKTLITQKPIFKAGKDDLDVMLRYYRDADNVIVFSGDFSWLQAAHPLCAEVNKLFLAQKIKFVSNKSIPELTIGMGANYAVYQSRIKPNSGVDIKCSLVEKGQRKVLIYVADTSLDSDGTKKVCVVSGRDDAAYLLQTIEKLCKKI